MSARTEAAAELVSQRNALGAQARKLTEAAAALLAAENASALDLTGDGRALLAAEVPTSA